jgi:hypothetical protein
VTEFVGCGAQGPAQVESEVLARIAVTVDGPDAGTLPQIGLPKDKGPAKPRPQVRSRQHHITVQRGFR